MARLIVRLAAWLVPARLRREWQMEWHGELAAASRDGRTGLARFALGSFADAFWIRQRDLSDLTFIDDLRHGWRQLRQQAGFALTAIAILAITMAASVVAFSVVSQILLRPLPYPAPDRIVTLRERQPAADAPGDVAPGNFFDWRARAASYSHLAGVEPYSYDYVGGDRPVVLRAAQVTEGFFEAFGIAPLAGRFFAADEYKKGNNRVAVISEQFWRNHLGADPAVIGRTLALGDGGFLIAGIAPADFEPNLFSGRGASIELWTAKAVEDYELRRRTGGYWQVFGRLRPGVSLESAQAEINAISAQIETENPRTNKGVRAAVVSLRDHLVGEARPAVQLFSIAVVAVLLIACVNVTNLLLARGSARHQELAIRAALGANRSRLIGQLLAETALLVIAATVAAVVLADGAMRILSRLGPTEVLWLDALHVDAAALAFAAVLAALVVVAAGLAPALRLSDHGLQAHATRATTGDRSQRRIRSVLVAAEVALALILVSGTALLLRSFVNLLHVDTGFQKQGVVALQMFAWDRNPTRDAVRTFFERVTSAAAAVPGIDEVGLVTAMPFIESNINVEGVIRLVGRAEPAPGDEPRASFNTASPGYFNAMRLPLLRGRLLDAGDHAKAPPVIVISEAMAARYFPDRDPIGQAVAFRYNGRVMQPRIVGVVGATRHESLDEQPRVELFVPFAQAPSGSMTLVVRAAVASHSVIEAVKAAVWAVDPLQTFYRVATLEELVDRMLVTRRFALIVLVGFATLALVLAAAGLYGVLSAIVSQYRREIGVRMALGAGWLDIVRLIVARGLAVSAFGVAAGLAGALGGSQLLRGFLFSVAPGDPIAIGGAAALILVIAAAASYLPARRAANDDPVAALRFE